MSIKIGSVAVKGQGKYHSPAPSYLDDIKERYGAMARVTKNDLRDEDVEYLLDAYANDITVDVLNIAETLRISKSTLYKLLKDERFAPLYESAKIRRSQLAINTGYKALLETYEGTKDNSVSREQVNASRNLANYMLEYSKMVNPESVDKERGDSKLVNITLALPTTPYNSEYEVINHDGD